jgi:hypothetical protein
LHFIFRSVNHFELIFCVKWKVFAYVQLSAYGNLIIPAAFIKNTILFSPELPLHLGLLSVNYICMGLALGF